MKRLAATVMWWQARPTGFTCSVSRDTAHTGRPAAMDKLAARFHHHLVQIHPWPNGNGRHARLATDLLLHRWGRPHFSWGGATHASDDSALRDNYLTALRAADAGSFDELFRFARS